MAADTAQLGTDAVRRALVLAIPLELVMTGAMAATWIVVGLAQPGFVSVVVVAHALAWLGLLLMELAPLRRLGAAGARVDDGTLLAADAALQRLPRRMAFANAGLWLIADVLWVVVGRAGLLGPPLGDAEAIAGVMFACTAPGIGPLTLLLFDSVFENVHEPLGRMLAERDLRPPRPRVSLTRPLVAAAAWMLFGAVFVIAGASIVWNTQQQRAHTLATHRHLVELGAARNDAGRELPEGVEIVARADLPQPLRDALAEQAEDTSVVVANYDVPRELATVAVRLGDGRYALSSGTSDMPLARMTFVVVVLMVVALPMFTVAFSLFARSITGPLDRFTDAAQQFVEHGELQGLERIVPLRNDELGRLAASFNGMLDILQQLTAAAAAVSAGDLRVELEHPGELHDAFRGMLVRLNEIVLRMRETSLELASAAAEINALTQQQEQATLTQSSDIQHVAATVSSLAASAGQIAQATQSVRHDAEQALSTTDTTAAQIAQLRLHTTSIGELLQVIGEIASRSDLLALNGSLESTRAGEAGRGFALVAAEMRRLAERVARTVEDVRVQVTDVETSSTSTVVATEESRRLAQRTAEAARDISKVTAQQSADTDQASLGVQSVADMVVEATLAMSQTRAAAEGLREHAAELERLMATFAVREDP